MFDKIGKQPVLFFVALLFLLAIDSLHSESLDTLKIGDPSALINKTVEASQKIKTIESDFIQKKRLSFLSEDVISKGKFYFKKDNFIRWEYLKPFKYLMVMNDDKYYIRDNGKVSVFNVKSNKLLSEVNDIIISCLNGSVLKDKDKFSASFFELNNFYMVKLKPLLPMMKEYIKQIEIHFDKNDFSLLELNIVEPNDDFTRIEFRNRKINTKISDEIFTVK